MAFIIAFFAGRPASAIDVSYDERGYEGVRRDGHTEPLAEAQSVTIEANLDSPEDVKRAIEAAQVLIGDTPSDHVSMVEATNAEAPLSSANEALVSSLRTRFQPESRGTIALTSQMLSKIQSRVVGGVAKAGRMAYSAVTDPHRLSLMVFRFTSASAAAYVGVSLATNVPVSVANYWHTFGSTFQTGLMSASFVMFSEWYVGIISRPGFLAHHIDESKWANELVHRFKAATRVMKEGVRSDVLAVEQAPLKFGRYTDQILRNLSLEMIFVMTSTSATEGFVNAARNAPHAMLSGINGGLGQTFFDMSFALIAKAREQAIIENYPEGPVRDAKIKRLKHMRDAAMALNSVAQVWMVMIAARGNALAQTALHFYFGAGVLTRFVLLNRLENKLILKEKAAAAATAPATSHPRPVRCEDVFRAA